MVVLEPSSLVLTKKVPQNFKIFKLGMSNLFHVQLHSRCFGGREDENIIENVFNFLLYNMTDKQTWQM